MRGSQRKRRNGLPAGDAREVAIGLYGIHRRIKNDPSSWTPFGIMQGCTGTRVRHLPGVSFGQGNRQDARGGICNPSRASLQDQPVRLANPGSRGLLWLLPTPVPIGHVDGVEAIRPDLQDILGAVI